MKKFLKRLINFNKLFFGFSETSKLIKQKKIWAHKYGPCILSDFYVSEFIHSEEDHIKAYEPTFPLPEAKIALSSPKKPPKVAREDLRIVWCDGAETLGWENRPYQYLGIRIHQGLILHETFVPQVYGKYIQAWCDRCGARMLTLEELKLVLTLKHQINSMREDMMDTAFEPSKGAYWAVDKNPDGSDRLIIYHPDYNCDGKENYHCVAVLLLAVKSA